MTAILGALVATGAAGGLVLLIAGIQRRPIDSRPVPRSALRHQAGLLAGNSHRARRQRAIVAAATVAGIVAWALTGWFVLAPLAPVAAIGVPYLLRSEDRDVIKRLDALEEWSRSLAALLTAGNGIEHSIIATAGSAPEAIRAEIATLTRRLRAGADTDTALRMFADELNDPTADLVVARLLQAAHRRGPGVAAMIDTLAESVADQVQARRTLESERSKPRSAARWATLISLAMLAYLFTREAYVEPYQSPLGQLILTVLLAAYGAALMWMKSSARVPQPPRFIHARTSGRQAQTAGGLQ